MDETRRVDVLARVEHLQHDSKTGENRHALLLVVRVREEALSKRERRPERSAVEDTPAALVLLLGVVLGHHDEYRRSSMRADADEVVDVGGVTHAADDVTAELGAPGQDAALREHLRQPDVHLLLADAVVHDDDVAHRERRRRPFQQPEPLERRHERREIEEDAEELPLVEHLVLPPQERALHHRAQRRLVPAQDQGVPVRRHLGPPRRERVHELRHGVGDETDEDGEHHQAEKDLDEVQQPQAVLVGDVVERRGGDELHRHEHPVRHGVLSEHQLGGVRAEPVPEHAEEPEHEGRDERQEHQGEGAVRGDAILEAVGHLIPIAQRGVGVLDALAARLSNFGHGGVDVIRLHRGECGEDGVGASVEGIVLGAGTRGVTIRTSAA